MKRVTPKEENSAWDLIIKPKKGWVDIDIAEVFRYKDLILLFVRRDFVTFYKQTILGPFWYIIQPIANSLVFTLIFGKVANIPTDGLPPFLFYLSGTVIWAYFAQCLSITSNTFVMNSDIFGKVYFPRMVVPISVVLTAVFQFTIQFIIFLAFMFFFWWRGAGFQPNFYVLALPLIVLHMAILSVGIGMLVSALTAKYRDLTFAMGFMIQLWMYLTPIVYPLSEVPDRFRVFILINPMTAVVETFRGAFLGVNSLELRELGVSILLSISFFLIGAIVFKRVEKNFMDTV